jgi:hypothetical protein
MSFFKQAKFKYILIFSLISTIILPAFASALQPTYEDWCYSTGGFWVDDTCLSQEDFEELENQYFCEALSFTKISDTRLNIVFDEGAPGILTTGMGYLDIYVSKDSLGKWEPHSGSAIDLEEDPAPTSAGILNNQQMDISYHDDLPGKISRDLDIPEGAKLITIFKMEIVPGSTSSQATCIMPISAINAEDEDPTEDPENPEEPMHGDKISEEDPKTWQINPDLIMWIAIIGSAVYVLAGIATAAFISLRKPKIK